MFLCFRFVNCVQSYNNKTFFIRALFMQIIYKITDLELVLVQLQSVFVCALCVVYSSTDLVYVDGGDPS